MINDSVNDVTMNMEELSLLPFRKVDDVKKLAKHFYSVIHHPSMEKSPVLLKYLKNLNESHKRAFFKKRDLVEVEYIFTTEKKSSMQRQRFNSLPVSEVPELLKAELLTAENATQIHICTDCDVEIELNDEEPLMESLQKHFNLEVHLPRLKRESITVAEPIVLPKMSRRLSALECGDTPGQSLEQLMQMVKPLEKLDRNFATKLETVLKDILPDNSEGSINAAIRFYQEAYHNLCQEVAIIDFSTQISSVAPIIMSIKDNVYQNFASDTNKNADNDENDLTPEKSKNLPKKYRYYGPIESMILKLLTNHKILTLIDDRTGKLAFFCIACEYYTLRFHYDSVLNHVFNDIHINNLSCILIADKHIPFTMGDASTEKIREMNEKFLMSHDVVNATRGMNCRLCHTTIESPDSAILHILDERHLAKLSDELYKRMKQSSPDGSIPDEWGPKDLNWSKYLASVGKPQNNKDHIIIENFIKPSGKIANFCTCCDMTLKGPRQVLFNHIRQKKHLRNAAPRKLTLLYKNHCRPSEFYASFGNYYICSVCPDNVALPSFAAIYEHFESTGHVRSIAKLLRIALFSEIDKEILAMNEIEAGDVITCELCVATFENLSEAMKHVLSSVDHQNMVTEAKYRANRGDIISVYMKGHYILHSEGATFTCVSCGSVFNSIRSLLSHLVYAEHFQVKPSTDSVFRFYLELKHNINMLQRNKYVYYKFGELKCGVCDGDIGHKENAKRHVVSPRHRENMGASYVTLDASGME